MARIESMREGQNLLMNFGNTLATDPGARYFAVAVTSFVGECLFAKQFTLRKADEHLSTYERALVLARRIHEDVRGFRCDLILLEGQVVRQEQRGQKRERQVSGNDLLPLAFNNGVIGCALQAFAWNDFRAMPTVRLISPADWKGTKQADQFIANTRASLTEAERGRMAHDNGNVVDAIAFAKWGASRRAYWQQVEQGLARGPGGAV